MDKKRVLSIAASAVLAGSIFTGCSWNDDDDAVVTGSSSSGVQIEDGLVVSIPAGGVIVTNDSNLTCISVHDINATNKKFIFSAGDFTCEEGMNFSSYTQLQVLEGARLDSDGNNVYTLDDNLTSDITVKARSTDTVASILTTLYVEAPAGTAGDALRASLANVGTISPSDVIASAPQYYALSQQIKKAKNAGFSVSTLASDLNITSLDSATNLTIGFKAGTLVLPAAQTLVGTSSVKAVAEVARTVATTTGLTTAQKSTLLLNNIEKSTTTDIGTMINNIAAAAAPTGVTIDSSSITTAVDALLPTGSKLTDLNTSTTSLDANLTAPKLTLNSATITIGETDLVATANNFSKTMTAVSSALDIGFGISVASANLPVEGITTTVQAKISNEEGQSITLKITNVKIEKGATAGSVKVTLNSSSVVTLGESNLPLMYNAMVGTTYQKNIVHELVQRDLNFKLSTLLTALGSSESARTLAIKNAIADYASQAGTYTVAVGITGLGSTQTNLSNVATATGLTGAVGVQGTLNISPSQTTTPTTPTYHAPVLTLPSTLDVRVGENMTTISLINATTDADSGDVVTYTVTGLPAGLSYDSTTKTISGNPTTANSTGVTVTITATDSHSMPATATINVVVLAASTSGGDEGTTGDEPGETSGGDEGTTGDEPGN